MRTCGECKWCKSSKTKRRGYGRCDAPVPDWCYEHIREDRAWLRRLCDACDECDCFAPREETEDED